jgi:hypothetical protein
MSWVKLDDTFPEHPKLIAAGPLAGWLWVVGLAYCTRHLTDGIIPAAVVPRLVGDTIATRTRQRCVTTLVRVGLWKRDTNGDIRVHDYLDYQPSRAEVLRMRQARVNAGSLGGTRSGETRRAGRNPEANAQANASANAQALASDIRSKRSSKIEPHPIPSPEETEGGRDDAPPWVATLPFPPLPGAWWSALFRLFPGLDHEATARDAAAYYLDHRDQVRDLPGFLRRQFSSAFTRHRAALPPDPYVHFTTYWNCNCVDGYHTTPSPDLPNPGCPHAATPPASGSPA